MRVVGISILALGVGLCAAFGARQTVETFERARLNGRAQFAEEAAHALFTEYCARRSAAGLPALDECPTDAPPGTPESPAHTGSPELRELRAAWLEARDAAALSSRRAHLTRPQPPGERLTSWVALSGLPFAVGLLLIAVGAIIARVGIRRAALAAADDGAEGAVDFGELLAALCSELDRLQRDMSAVETPEDETIERAKRAIGTLQVERLEPLVEARARAQIRLGLSGFAAVFGPLSSAERRANRAWSALVDGHWLEARDAVARAAEDARAARSELERLAAA